MTPGAGGSFLVVHSSALLGRVRAMGQRAHARGINHEFAGELRRVQHLLSNDPLNCGDERGELPFLGLQRRHKVLRIFCVRFAVDRLRRIVYVQDYVPTLDYAFLDPS